MSIFDIFKRQENPNRAQRRAAVKAMRAEDKQLAKKKASEQRARMRKASTLGIGQVPKL